MEAKQESVSEKIMEQSIKDIQESLNRLKSLLDEPEIGLSVWHDCLKQTNDELSQRLDELSQRLHETFGL